MSNRINIENAAGDIISVATNDALLRKDSFSLQLAREGRPMGSAGGSPAGYTTGTPATVTAGVVVDNSGTSTVPLGRAYVLYEAAMTADRSCIAVLQFQDILSGAYTTDSLAGYKILGPNGGEAKWTWPSGLIVPELHNLQLRYIRPDTAGAFTTKAFSGLDITADFHWDAEHVICVAGDSLTHTIPGSNGTTGAVGEDLWAFRLTNRLRDKGASVRLINKGFGGSIIPQAHKRLRSGFYDVPYDLLVVSYGMNDAAADQTGETRYKDGLRAFVTHRNRHRPDATVVICGPSSTDDANRTPYIGNYRTWASQVAAEYGAAERVYYVDLSTSYAASATASFGESVAGTLVHANIVGQSQLADVICNAVELTDFYTDTLGLTGEL